MRSFVFLVMLAFSLVAMECATSTAEDNGGLQTEQQHVAAGSVVTTKAVEKASALDGELKSDEDPDAQHRAPENPADPEQASTSLVQPPPDVPQHGQELTQQNQQQQQQQQQRQSQTGTSHGTKDSRREPGSTKQSGDHAAPIVRSEEESRTGQAETPERNEGEDTNQDKPNEPSQPLKEQPPPSSQSTVGGGKKSSTSITTTENGTGKDITPPGTATTHGAKDNVPAEKPATSIASRTDNAATQTGITTGDKKTDSTQTSVPSTTESENGESTVQTTSLKNLSKALQSSDTKDGTIDSSPLFALIALVTLVMMAVAPAS